MTARELGRNPLILGDGIEGESREVAKLFTGLVRSVSDRDMPATKPCVVLSGGEATVTVHGDGRSGRNTRFLLALRLAVSDLPNVAALADNEACWYSSKLDWLVMTGPTLTNSTTFGLSLSGD